MTFFVTLIADCHWCEVAAGLGAALGGIGAALGAFFAWRSATASRETGRDARDALAHAIAPSLQLDFYVEPTGEGDTGRWTARVINPSPQFAATESSLEAFFEDGVHFAQTVERIGAGEHQTMAMREMGMPPGGPTQEQAGKTAVIRYSDERRIARYEEDYGFAVRKASDGGRIPLPSAFSLGPPRRI